MTKKDLKIIKQHHHLFLKYSCNEESIKLHGNSVSVQQVQKYHINIMAPCRRTETIVSIWLREKNSELSACFKVFKKMHDKAKDVNGTQMDRYKLLIW
jgi:hypothetical protein